MQEPRTILCAADLSPTSDLAIMAAAAFAGATQSRLELLHVTGAGLPDADPATLSPAVKALQARLDQRRRRAVEQLEATRDTLESKGISTNIHVVDGRPWEEIVGRALEIDALMAVLGPHGHGGPVGLSSGDGGNAIGAWLLGTTADRVLRQAPCPVLVGPRQAPAGPILGSPWLVPVDFSPSCREALKVAAGLAPTGTELKLLHVIGHDEPEITNDSQVLSDLQRLADEVVGTVLPAMVKQGPTAETLCAVARAEDAGLIVMGTEARGRLGQLLLGSTTERTLRATTTPVLCVRASAAD